MTKIDVHVQGLNFYWSEKNYKYPDGSNIKVVWEDVDYAIHLPDGVRKGGTVLETKKLYEYELEDLNGNIGKAMEEKFPGYIEEHLSDTYFNMSIPELIKQNKLLWGFTYDIPGSENFFEITDMINLPKNEEGIFPSLVIGYLPIERITKKDVEFFITEYAKNFFGVNDNIKINWVKTPTNEELEKEYKNFIGEINYFTSMRERGEKPKIIILPQPLSMIIGKNIVSYYTNKGMKHAEYLSESDEYLAHFEDGTTEIINKDIVGDHFSTYE